MALSMWILLLLRYISSKLREHNPDKEATRFGPLPWFNAGAETDYGMYNLLILSGVTKL